MSDKKFDMVDYATRVFTGNSAPSPAMNAASQKTITIDVTQESINNGFQGSATSGEEERERFEKWAEAHTYLLDRARDGWYISVPAQHAWNAWRAALAAKAEQSNTAGAAKGGNTCEEFVWLSVDGSQHNTGRVTYQNGGFFADTASPEDAERIANALNFATSVAERAAAPASVPECCTLVPMKLTEEMHIAAVRAIVRSTGNDDFPPAVWSAMISAAPEVAQPAAQGEIRVAATFSRFSMDFVVKYRRAPTGQESFSAGSLAALEQHSGSEAARLRKALNNVRNSLQFANDSPGGGICDTLWMMDDAETIFDHIDAALATPAPTAAKGDAK